MCKKKFVLISKTYDKRGRLIAAGVNSYKKSHPLQNHIAEKVGLPAKMYLHSEIQAILKSKDKPIYRITIERYGSNGEHALAAPCPICQEAIKMYNIRVVEYTTKTGWTKYVLQK